jgi:hypothetical protein
MRASGATMRSPAVLPRLVTAFETVRAGKVAPSPASSGKVIYRVDGFSFLMVRL